MSDLLDDLLARNTPETTDDGWRSCHELVMQAAAERPDLWEDTDRCHRKMLELIHLKAATMERSRRQRPGRFGEMWMTYVYRRKR